MEQRESGWGFMRMGYLGSGATQRSFGDRLCKGHHGGGGKDSWGGRGEEGHTVRKREGL